MPSEDNVRRALVVVPTYNEAANIEALVEQILAQSAPLDVLIVDDASPDGTGRLGDALARADARVRVYHRSAELGLGTAYLAGFDTALAGGYGHVITMDADFPTPSTTCPACSIWRRSTTSPSAPATLRAEQPWAVRPGVCS